MVTKKQLHSFAARMKKRPTPSELKTNLLLSSAGYRYLTQLVYGFYILDFIIPSKLLVIEIDGSSHDNKQSYDARRDSFIQETGLSIIHIKNEDVDTLLLPLILSFPDLPSPDKSFKTCIKKANALYRRANPRKKICRNKK